MQSSPYIETLENLKVKVDDKILLAKMLLEVGIVVDRIDIISKEYHFTCGNENSSVETLTRILETFPMIPRKFSTHHKADGDILVKCLANISEVTKNTINIYTSQGQFSLKLVPSIQRIIKFLDVRYGKWVKEYNACEPIGKWGEVSYHPRGTNYYPRGEFMVKDLIEFFTPLMYKDNVHDE